MEIDASQEAEDVPPKKRFHRSMSSLELGADLDE